MKKSLFILTFVCLLLSGCKGYTRDDTPGKIERISVAQMEEKIKNKEEFTILFSQSWCTHCNDFKVMLDGYLPNHNVTVYEVSIDEDENKNRKEVIKKIQSHFKTMTATPALYYVKNGKIVNELVPDDDGITEEKFDSWVQRYKLDEKK